MDSPRNFTPGRLPACWTEAPFAGNGLLGLMVYADFPAVGWHWADRPDDGVQPSGIRFDLGRADVFDRGSDKVMPLWHTPNRVPIAKLVLPMDVGLADGEIALDCRSARLKGLVAQRSGEAAFSAYVHATRPVFAVSLAGEGGRDLNPEIVWAEAPRWDWAPGSKGSGKTDSGKVAAEVQQWRWSEPIFERVEEDPRLRLSSRSLSDGSEIAIAMLERVGRDGSREFIVAVGNDPRNRREAQTNGEPGNDAKTDAWHAVVQAAERSPEELWEEHAGWWADYYRSSVVCLPDSELQDFYDLQVYKRGCVFREEGPVPDEVGPWSIQSEYPCHWWDLNIQDCHSANLPGGHARFSVPLLRLLERSLEETALGKDEAMGISTITSFRFSLRKKDSADSPYPFKRASTANLIWVAHHFRECWSYSGDMRFASLALRLLRLALRSYKVEDRLEYRDDGRIWIRNCISPEYPGANHDAGYNSNYELALLRWGCEALRELAEHFDELDDEVSELSSIGPRLASYPVDEKGYRISESVGVRSAHRHFSHLMMLYPLRLLETPEERELAKRSLLWWIGDEIEPEAKGRSGFTYTFAASMAAELGMGEEALEYLRYFVNGTRSGKGFVRSKSWPNTMYTEWGPAIETPMGFARAVADMLVLSRPDEIRLFPGVPESWNEVGFEDLKTHGGHSVSAGLARGKLRHARLRRGHARRARLRHPQIGRLRPSNPLAVFRQTSDSLDLNLEDYETLDFEADDEY